MSALSIRGIFTTLSDPTSPGVVLPVWSRIGYLAVARADHHGHARLGTGQLAALLHTSPQRASDALVVARGRGVIDHTSHAGCLVLPGCGLNPCEERHRD